MRNTGLQGRIDSLGRLCIPKIIRDGLGLEQGTLITLWVEQDRIILQKHEQTCVFCHSSAPCIEYKQKLICGECLKTLLRFRSK